MPKSGSNAAELPYSFRHALFRQVLYERTNPSVRLELHRKVGTTLERERAAGAQVAAAELAMHFELGREPMTALRYYAEAAEGALARLSPAECMGLTERALTLLEQAPEGTERNALEIALATLRGVSATHVHGIGHPEARKRVPARVLASRRYSAHPMRGTAAARDRIRAQSSRGLCRRAGGGGSSRGALAAEPSDPVLVLVTCMVLGTRLSFGPTARGSAHGSSAGSRPRASRMAPAEMFVADPRVSLLGLLGMQPSQFRGCRTGARAVGASARTRSPAGMAQRGWRPSGARRCSRSDSATRSGSRHWPTRCARSSTNPRSRKVEPRAGGFAAGRTPGCGQPRDGYRRIREAYEDNTRLGMLAGGSEVLGYAVEALVLDGDWDGAQRELEGALQVAARSGSACICRGCCVMQAAIARARGHLAAADASIRRALAESGAQEAPWLELLALIELCDRHGATAKDQRALAALVDQLPEARDTSAVAKARALLDKAKSA